MNRILISFAILIGCLVSGGCIRIKKNSSCVGCEFKTIIRLSENLNEQSIQDFFCTLESNCLRTNIEFSETANEQIFIILDKNPTLFIMVFNKVDTNKKQLILDMIATPIHDIINVKSLEQKIFQLSANKKSVQAIINALEIAEQKMKE